MKQNIQLLIIGVLASWATISSATSSDGFPNLPYTKKIIIATSKQKPADSKESKNKVLIPQSICNPICVDPDAPCNGDPRDTYSGGDWIPYFDDYIAAQGNNGGFERAIFFWKEFYSRHNCSISRI